MCACEPGFTCSRCAGTPFDPMYLFDEPDPITPAEFDVLAATHRVGDEWQERFWRLS